MGQKKGLAEKINIQNMNVPADKYEKPWYRDPKLLIAIASVLVAAVGVLVTKGIL